MRLRFLRQPTRATTPLRSRRITRPRRRRALARRARARLRPTTAGRFTRTSRARRSPSPWRPRRSSSKRTGHAVHQEVLPGAPLFFVIPANFWQRHLDVFCYGRLEDDTQMLIAAKVSDADAGLPPGIPLALNAVDRAPGFIGYQAESGFASNAAQGD